MANDVEEIEVDEDAIVGYIVDEDDKELGFIVLDDEGNEVEYYYADEDDVDGADGATNASEAPEGTAIEKADADSSADCQASEEFEEIEVDEDAIVGYIVDEDDKDLGFIVLDDDGNEVEYYYADEEEDDLTAPVTAPTSKKSAKDDNPYDPGITREGVAEATSNMNDIYRDGVEIASELKGAYDDIKEAFDFSDIIPGKKKK